MGGGKCNNIQFGKFVTPGYNEQRHFLLSINSNTKLHTFVSVFHIMKLHSLPDKLPCTLSAIHIIQIIINMENYNAQYYCCNPNTSL